MLRIMIVSDQMVSDVVDFHLVFSAHSHHPCSEAESSPVRNLH
jgi:hypothetical protein